MSLQTGGKITAAALVLGIVVAESSVAENSESVFTDKGEKCGVLFRNASGTLENKVLPSLHLITLDDGATFSLPKDAPANVETLMCGRESITPHANDYKALIAGYPLNIVVDDRVGVLEVSSGQLRFRMIRGKMTEAETRSVQEFLNDSQKFFDAPESSEKSGSSK